jgi:hypothetical protein
MGGILIVRLERGQYRTFGSSVRGGAAERAAFKASRIRRMHGSVCFARAHSQIQITVHPKARAVRSERRSCGWLLAILSRVGARLRAQWWPRSLGETVKAELIRLGWTLERTHELERLLDELIARRSDLLPSPKTLFQRAVGGTSMA